MIMEFLRVHRSRLLPAAAALLGVLFLARGIAAYKKRLGYQMKPVAVLISVKPLGEGRALREGDLEPREVPERYLPVGAVRETDLRSVLGRPITRPMAEGEMLLWTSIDTGEGPVGPARAVANGYRAISLSVDPVSSVAHAIRSRDHVDLLATTDLPGRDGSTTFTLLQNVAVLSVGEETDQEGEAYSVVSLMVLPKESALIAHAQQHAKITLALRNPADHKTPADLPMVSKADLLESAFRNSLQQERNDSVEIIRGGKRSSDPSLP